MQVSMTDAAADHTKNIAALVKQLQTAPPNEIPAELIAQFATWSANTLQQKQIAEARKLCHGKSPVLFLIRNILVSLEDMLAQKVRIAWEP